MCGLSGTLGYTASKAGLASSNRKGPYLLEDHTQTPSLMKVRGLSLDKQTHSHTQMYTVCHLLTP